jgi:uncharacterized membrane protein
MRHSYSSTEKIFSTFYYHLMGSIKRIIIIQFVCCLFLVGIRVFQAESIYYSWLIWNLVLALIPLLIAHYLYKRIDKIPKHPYKTFFALLAWFLFLPNAPYLITDLIHLKAYAAIPLWYDSILLFFCAMVGLTYGILSIYYIHMIMKKYILDKYCWWILGYISMACGYGVFLGRILRFNSWDIIAHPHYLVYSSLKHLDKPQAIEMTLAFAVVVFISYTSFYHTLLLKKHLNHESTY